MPEDPQAKELRKNNVRKGLRIGLPIMGGMASVAIPAITRKPKEARLDAQGTRQDLRASRKESRAERIEDKKPTKAKKLREKSSELKAKASANKKAAELIYNSKTAKNKKK